jgi:guanylate kinase
MTINAKRIVITGKGASGKDHLRNRFIEKGWTKAISCTTRPPRPGEKNRVDYHFLTEKEFKNKIENDEFYEYKIFNGWYYGTLKSMMVANNMVFIMTPKGVNDLKEKERNNSFVIFLDIDDEILEKRLRGRKDADNVERRIEADKKDFKNFDNYDLIIKNYDF